MKILVILNNAPYDGTDIAFNGLRLAGQLKDNSEEVRIFLMNDAVDMAREETLKPDSYDVDLKETLRELIKKGVPVKVCGSCMTRCGIHKNKPYFEGAEKSTMKALSEWVTDSDKVITF